MKIVIFFSYLISMNLFSQQAPELDKCSTNEQKFPIYAVEKVVSFQIGDINDRQKLMFTAVNVDKVGRFGHRLRSLYMTYIRLGRTAKSGHIRTTFYLGTLIDHEDFFSVTRESSEVFNLRFNDYQYAKRNDRWSLKLFTYNYSIDLSKVFESADISWEEQKGTSSYHYFNSCFSYKRKIKKTYPWF